MIQFLKREKVMDIAFILAAISIVFVRPDKEYIQYIDFRVLAILFGLMILVKGFQNAGLLDWMISRLFGKIKNLRTMIQILVLLCFFMSMVMTNDVALITFVPFAILALTACGQQKQIIPVVVLQTLAANLGSMFTPIGNPQNLYLFTASGMSVASFFATMAPITGFSLLLHLLATYFIRNTEISLKLPEESAELSHNKKDLLVYTLLFVLNLLVVFRVVHFLPVLVLTILTLMAAKKSSLFGQVDYALLLTFVGFFIFVGNMGRIPAISNLVKMLITGRAVFISALFSQFLSNVPAALLLSGFTGDFRGLLIGTNIGGLGTLIASMASLISYKAYAESEGADTGRYLLVFTAANILGLICLSAFTWIVY
ncbi:MAG: SLC13 family permease [Lachnospiraceae bacterium]|nr:SLC13 family permease [Lachnospiraceae bacterium]